MASILGEPPLYDYYYMPCYLSPIKVNWPAPSPKSPSNGQTQRISTTDSKLFHVFVGDLAPDVEVDNLKQAFTAFGTVTDCRVLRDPATGKSKGYGFVSFESKLEAEAAIQGMNGQVICNRQIRTNWATRKPQPPGKKLDFDEVYKQSSETNCTVYIGNLTNGLGGESIEDLLQKTFAPFGQIQEIRVFKDKGYGFVRFSNKISAAKAICEVHNTEVSGQVVKCSWGRESTDPTQSAAQAAAAAAAAAAVAVQQQPAYAAAQFGQFYPQVAASYWYGAQNPGAAAAAASHALQPAAATLTPQGAAAAAYLASPQPLAASAAAAAAAANLNQYYAATSGGQMTSAYGVNLVHTGNWPNGSVTAASQLPTLQSHFTAVANGTPGPPAAPAAAQFNGQSHAHPAPGAAHHHGATAAPIAGVGYPGSAALQQGATILLTGDAHAAAAPAVAMQRAM